MKYVFYYVFSAFIFNILNKTIPSAEDSVCGLCEFWIEISMHRRWMDTGMIFYFDLTFSDCIQIIFIFIFMIEDDSVFL